MNDTYLGMIYVCCWCRWRLTECKCPPDPPGWDLNRYPIGVDAELYALGPIAEPPMSFVRIEDDTPGPY
jgi:hypothetical protein